MSAPSIQGLFALGQEFVALIDRRHPRNRPRLVVEDFVGNVRRNAQASHSGDHGSSQIVHAPSRDGRIIGQWRFSLSRMPKRALSRWSQKRTFPADGSSTTRQACSDKCTICAFLFLVREPGIDQVRLRSSSSSHLRRDTSLRLCPVRASNSIMPPYGDSHLSRGNNDSRELFVGEDTIATDLPIVGRNAVRG